jgi:ubiquitin-protein ligase
MAQHIHRLGRDLRELSQHNFDCSASNMCIQTIGISTHLSLCIKGGPYSTAHYSFRLDIPESFPFKCPSILATVPVWHPNIELRTGVVTLPIEWTPDLRLLDLALHLQVMISS